MSCAPSPICASCNEARSFSRTLSSTVNSGTADADVWRRASELGPSVSRSGVRATPFAHEAAATDTAHGLQSMPALLVPQTLNAAL